MTSSPYLVVYRSEDGDAVAIVIREKLVEVGHLADLLVFDVMLEHADGVSFSGRLVTNVPRGLPDGTGIMPSWYETWTPPKEPS